MRFKKGDTVYSAQEARKGNISVVEILSTDEYESTGKYRCWFQDTDTKGGCPEHWLCTLDEMLDKAEKYLKVKLARIAWLRGVSEKRKKAEKE